MKKKNICMSKPAFWLCIGSIGVVCFLAGILIGIVVQQMMFTANLVEIGESLEGVNLEINIDLNESKIIQGFRETLGYVFNKTVENQSYA